MDVVLNDEELCPLGTWAHNYRVYTYKRFNDDSKGIGNYLVRGKMIKIVSKAESNQSKTN